MGRELAVSRPDASRHQGTLWGWWWGFIIVYYIYLVVYGVNPSPTLLSCCDFFGEPVVVVPCSVCSAGCMCPGLCSHHPSSGGGSVLYSFSLSFPLDSWAQQAHVRNRTHAEPLGGKNPGALCRGNRAKLERKCGWCPSLPLLSAGPRASFCLPCPFCARKTTGFCFGSLLNANFKNI